MKTLPFWLACVTAFAVPFLGALAKGFANPSGDRFVSLIEAIYFGFIGLSSIGFNKIVKASIERKDLERNQREQ